MIEMYRTLEAEMDIIKIDKLEKGCLDKYCFAHRAGT